LTEHGELIACAGSSHADPHLRVNSDVCPLLVSLIWVKKKDQELL
jgi:hypothetical protein